MASHILAAIVLEAAENSITVWRKSCAIECADVLNMGLSSKYARKRTGQVPAQAMAIDLHAAR